MAHAPWSSSKVQTALRCPREFHYRYVDKVREAATSPEARIGKVVHSTLERALTGTPITEAVARGRAVMNNAAERQRFDALEPGIGAFVTRIAAFRRRRSVTRQLVECTLAVRDDWTLTGFHAPDALYRGIFDAGYLFDDGQLAVVDHKCGERRISVSFTDQLESYAVLAAGMFRDLTRYWLGVHWVKDCVVEWGPPVSARDVHDRLAPRVLANIEAAALAVDDGPRPAPSDWCLLCSYRAICPAAHDLLLEPVEQEPPPDWEE